MDKHQRLFDSVKALGYTVISRGYRNQENADKGIYSERNWFLPNENYKLKSTDFYYDKERDFIHFTSYNALFDILDSKHLRLYNLLHMDDKFELEYARKALSFNYKSEKDKEEIYILSMCSALEILSEEPKMKKHLLWKVHGCDGKGVILKFKIMNEIDTWYSYHLTKCFYDLKNVNALKELHEITSNEFFDAKINCFLKLPIYQYENEIRLVFDFRHSMKLTKHNNLIYPVTYPVISSKSDKISYFQLPLYNFFKNDTNAYPVLQSAMLHKFEIPKIAITEVILGYRYNDNDLKELKEKIALIDPTINVKMSDLKQYY